MQIMKKRDVIERFCQISDRVASFKNHMISADCFCGTSDLWDHNFTFDPDILDFIENAINEKHERDQ